MRYMYVEIGVIMNGSGRVGLSQYFACGRRVGSDRVRESGPVADWQ